MIAFTLGVVVAPLTGALVWMFVTLYKLKKKFNWMTETWKEMTQEQSRFYEAYYRNREDDQKEVSRQFNEMYNNINMFYVSKEEMVIPPTPTKKTLLKG